MDALDLSDHAYLIYAALLRTQRLTIPDICQELTLSEDQITDELSALAARDLVQRSLEQPDAYVAANPQIRLGKLVAEKRAQVADLCHRLARSEASYIHLLSEYTEYGTSRAVGVERLVGIDAIRGRLDRLASTTKHELLSLAPDGPQPAESIAASRPLDEDMLKRGIRMRSLFLDSIQNDINSLHWVKWLAEMGGEVRSTAVLPLRFKVYDRRIAVVPADPARHTAEAVQVEIPGLVTALLALFEQIWESARPLGKRPQQTKGTPLEAELELLRLLSEGNTDEGVARNLGVSVRTARRRLADLMQRLGANSRFEAGARAAQLGWVKFTSD